MTYVMPDPTIYLLCPESGCGRRVGPYYDMKNANVAMETHIIYRHVNAQRRPFDSEGPRT